MEPSALSTEQWAQLMTMLPSDIEETVRQFGVLRRRREVRDAPTLILLAMSYAVVGRSLRDTAAWAKGVGLASLSDVALLKRLKAADDWLGDVCGTMLKERARSQWQAGRALRMRIVDASCVSRNRSPGTDWRIHLTYDLGAGRIDGIEMTDDSEGETFLHLSLRPGEIVVGDRGYAHRRGIEWATSHGAEVVVRLNLTNVPLIDDDGNKLDILSAADHLKSSEVMDIAAWTAPFGKSSVPSVGGRLVVLRKSDVAAQMERRKMMADAKRKRRVASPEVLESANYVMVFTTLSAASFPAADILEIYRFRWMVEMVFKRLKGILKIDEIPAHDEHLCRTFVFAKLLAALLIEDLTHAHVGFSPWGYGIPSESHPLAGDQVRSVRSPDGH
jgi:hypothetical protein